MLVTTMWDRLEAETGKRRERELVDRFWAKMIKHDASVGSFDNTESSALKIIQSFVDREASLQVLLLQEELADLKKRINETTVGMALHNHLRELLEKEKQALGKLESQAQQNANLAAAVKAERARTEERIENISNQLNASEISFSRKVRLFFKKQPKGVCDCKIVSSFCVFIYVLIIEGLGYYRKSLKLSLSTHRYLEVHFGTLGYAFL